MINKFNSPINIAATSKTPESTTAQIETSPIPGNHVNDISINDSINKSRSPPINRSLPATPVADVSTPPRFPTIINSSMNAEFEQLKSKLSIKIMT